MAGMSVSTGLISGINYDTMITQLMQVEANPQTLLKNKLLDTQADAKAYRAVNTKFDALRTAAEALTKTATWAAAKASSSATGVTATASGSASAGSLSFEVTQLASTAAYISDGTPWSSTTTSYGSTSITIADRDGDTAPVTIPLAAGATLADAVKAINAGNAGVTATAINTGAGYRLQLTAAKGGADGAFDITGSGTTTFAATSEGRDAVLDLGAGITATSGTNTFTDLMPGTTLTVSQTGPATVTVATDPAAVTAAVKAMVDAANDVLSTIATNTDSSAGSKAVLKGDSTLRSLTSKVLETISTAIGGNASASTAGLSLTREGKLAFDPTVFTAKLATDPTLVARLVNGADATNGPDQVAGGGDDTVAVQGVAQRLVALAKQASNTTTGILVLKAKGEDDEAADLTDHIADWDRRLELRKATLSAQFSALETALGTLQSQGSWLSSQLASLPSWSSSSK